MVSQLIPGKLELTVKNVCKFSRYAMLDGVLDGVLVGLIA